MQYIKGINISQNTTTSMPQEVEAIKTGISRVNRTFDYFVSWKKLSIYLHYRGTNQTKMTSLKQD